MRGKHTDFFIMIYFVDILTNNVNYDIVFIVIIRSVFMDLREYSISLLAECGCNLDCYKGVELQSVISDLMEYSKENTILYPIEDVAKMLVEIGNAQPDSHRKGHKKYCMVFDVGHTVDGVEFDTFEEAKNDAINTLENWIVDEQVGWNFETDSDGVSVIPHPTEKQIDSWDTMINDCSVYVVEWDEENNCWEDCDNAWYPSSDIENELNWLEWSELKKKYGW